MALLLIQNQCSTGTMYNEERKQSLTLCGGEKRKKKKQSPVSTNCGFANKLDQ